MKRVLVTRAFDRWCTLGGPALCRAAREVVAGRFEADLGSGLVKKRAAYPGADFSAAQVESAKELAVAFARLDGHQLGLALLRGAVKEIHCGEEDSSAR